MGNESSAATVLRTNLAEYPVTRAILDGRVRSDIVTLDCCGPPKAHAAFKAMLRENAYDVGEMAIVTYLQAKAYGKPYVLLPIPISGRFQHHCIGYNKAFGALDPKDIEGREVGVRTYAQTTGLWVRGILQHEYGVDLDKVTWRTIDESHLSEYSDPPNCKRLPKDASIPDMMLKGELAAAILGVDMPKDPRVERLVPNPFEDAERWYEREQVVPINHMFVVHEDISRNQPEVVQEIYRMLVESRHAVPKEDMPKVFPPIGLEANRKVLQMAIDWSYEQKIIPDRMSVDDLFDDTTAALVA